MRHRGIAALVGALGCLMLSGCTGAAHSAGHGTDGYSHDALRDLADIQAGKCNLVAMRLDATMRARLDARQMCADYGFFVAAFGSYRGHGNPVVIDVASDHVVRIQLQMASRPAEFRVTYDSTGKIAGLYFLRQGVPL